MLNHPDRGGDAGTMRAIQMAYDTLSDSSRRAAYDQQKSLDGSAEKQFGSSFAGKEDKANKGVSIAKGLEDSRDGKTGAISQSGFSMSHNSGFEAWLRNQKGLGKTGFYTAEDLLRQKKGGIEADGMSTLLPPLSTTAVCYDKHGPPDEVLYVDKARPLPEKLEHGEVLVHMLAACVNDEDLLRVQTSLAILNDFAPFNRTNNKWDEEELPAIAGIEGVGVVLATAQNVPTLQTGAAPRIISPDPSPHSPLPALAPSRTRARPRTSPTRLRCWPARCARGEGLGHRSARRAQGADRLLGHAARLRLDSIAKGARAGAAAAALRVLALALLRVPAARGLRQREAGRHDHPELRRPADGAGGDSAVQDAQDPDGQPGAGRHGLRPDEGAADGAGGDHGDQGQRQRDGLPEGDRRRDAEARHRCARRRGGEETRHCPAAWRHAGGNRPRTLWTRRRMN